MIYHISLAYLAKIKELQITLLAKRWKTDLSYIDRGLYIDQSLQDSIVRIYQIYEHTNLLTQQVILHSGT